jgi:phosphopantetheinyl transferase
MPLERLILPSPGVKIGFWKISESLEELVQIYNPTIDEKKIIQSMHEHKQKHHLASRILANSFYPDLAIVKDKFGKPHFSNSNTHLSWSHSGNYAAFISNENQPTGIDIETLGPKILRIEDKFCNKNDKAIIHKTHHAESLLIIWGAKESLYKWYGLKEIDFKLHMSIEAFDLHKEGRFFGNIHLPHLKKKFILEYMVFDAHISVWIVAEYDDD